MRMEMVKVLYFRVNRSLFNDCFNLGPPWSTSNFLREHGYFSGCISNSN